MFLVKGFQIFAMIIPRMHRVRLGLFRHDRVTTMVVGCFALVSVFRGSLFWRVTQQHYRLEHRVEPRSDEGKCDVPVVSATRRSFALKRNFPCFFCSKQSK